MRGADKIVPFERTKHVVSYMAFDGDYNYSNKVEEDGFKCEYWSNGQMLGIVFYSIEELKQLRKIGVIDDSKLRK